MAIAVSYVGALKWFRSDIREKLCETTYYWKKKTACVCNTRYFKMKILNFHTKQTFSKYKGYR